MNSCACGCGKRREVTHWMTAVKPSMPLPKIRGQGLPMHEAVKRFEQFGAALSKITDARTDAKIRMRMDVEVLGVGRFLSCRYWRYVWIAYGPTQ